MQVRMKIKSFCKKIHAQRFFILLWKKNESFGKGLRTRFSGDSWLWGDSGKFEVCDSSWLNFNMKCPKFLTTEGREFNCNLRVLETCTPSDKNSLFDVAKNWSLTLFNTPNFLKRRILPETGTLCRVLCKMIIFSKSFFLRLHRQGKVFPVRFLRHAKFQRKTSFSSPHYLSINKKCSGSFHDELSPLESEILFPHLFLGGRLKAVTHFRIAKSFLLFLEMPEKSFSPFCGR